MTSEAESLESLELKISHLLRKGVLFAGALLFIGWMMLIKFDGANPFVDAQSYRTESLTSRLALIFQNPGGNIGYLFCYAGLVVLISLPLLRVGMTAVLFFRQRDRLLGWVAVGVLLALVCSFALGIEV